MNHFHLNKYNQLQYAIYQSFIIQSNNKKAYLLLIIKTIKNNKKLNRRKASQLYNIPYTTLIYKINNLILYIEIQTNRYKLIELKKEIIIQYILNIDSKDFPSKYKGIKNIINYILKSKNTKNIKKL